MGEYRKYVTGIEARQWGFRSKVPSRLWMLANELTEVPAYDFGITVVDSRFPNHLSDFRDATSRGVKLTRQEVRIATDNDGQHRIARSAALAAFRGYAQELGIVIPDAATFTDGSLRIAVPEGDGVPVYLESGLVQVERGALLEAGARLLRAHLLPTTSR